METPEDNQQNCLCTKLREFLDAERSVILRHLNRHKWFQHIEDDNKGVMDFIEKYGWLMREMYCGYACEKRESCGFSKQLNQTNETKENENGSANGERKEDIYTTG